MSPPYREEKDVSSASCTKACAGFNAISQCGQSYSKAFMPKMTVSEIPPPTIKPKSAYTGQAMYNAD